MLGAHPQQSQDPSQGPHGEGETRLAGHGDHSPLQTSRQASRLVLSDATSRQTGRPRGKLAEGGREVATSPGSVPG